MTVAYVPLVKHLSSNSYVYFLLIHLFIHLLFQSVFISWQTVEILSTLNEEICVCMYISTKKSIIKLYFSFNDANKFGILKS